MLIAHWGVAVSSIAKTHFALICVLILLILLILILVVLVVLLILFLANHIKVIGSDFRGKIVEVVV